MSKASRQSITMLMVAASAFHHLHNKKYFARVDIHKLCRDGFDTATEIIKQWPDYEGEVKGKQWKELQSCVLNVAEWQNRVGDSLDYSAASFVYIAARLIRDLQDKVTNKKKQGLLSALDEHIERLEEFTDPEGMNFPAYEQGDKMLDILNEVTGWKY